MGRRENKERQGKEGREEIVSPSPAPPHFQNPKTATAAAVANRLFCISLGSAVTILR